MLSHPKVAAGVWLLAAEVLPPQLLSLLGEVVFAFSLDEEQVVDFAVVRKFLGAVDGGGQLQAREIIALITELQLPLVDTAIVGFADRRAHGHHRALLRPAAIAFD